MSGGRLWRRACAAAAAGAATARRRLLTRRRSRGRRLPAWRSAPAPATARTLGCGLRRLRRRGLLLGGGASPPALGFVSRHGGAASLPGSRASRRHGRRTLGAIGRGGGPNGRAIRWLRLAARGRCDNTQAPRKEPVVPLFRPAHKVQIDLRHHRPPHVRALLRGVGADAAHLQHGRRVPLAAALNFHLAPLAQPAEACAVCGGGCARGGSGACETSGRACLWFGEPSGGRGGSR